MKTLIENLCGKLKSWGIDPITLLKSIGVFLILVAVVVLIAIFPVLLVILFIILISVLMIVIIYKAIEEIT